MAKAIMLRIGNGDYIIGTGEGPEGQPAIFFELLPEQHKGKIGDTIMEGGDHQIANDCIILSFLNSQGAAVVFEAVSTIMDKFKKIEGVN